MAVKTDGATLKRYMADQSPQAWPAETYYEDDLIKVNGVDVGMDFDLSLVDDHAVIEIHGGTVLMEGNDEKAVAMTAHFKRWLRKQHYVTLLVEVHRDYVDGLKNAIQHHNGKVIS